ncbi:MAG: hypothetical protein ACRDRR_04020 [Pseudonocardiaceae bacterium]
MRRTIGLLTAGLLSLAAAAAAAPAAGADGLTDFLPGALDRGFGTNGIGSVPAVADDFDRYFDVAVDFGGKAYAVGTARKGAEGFFALTRILPNGTADPSFGTGGTALHDIVEGSTENARGVGLQFNGKIIVSGQARSLEPGANPSDVDIYVARFNTDGTLDTSFANAGTLRINLSAGAQVTPSSFRADQTYGLAVAPDGKIILVSTRGPDLADRPGRDDSDFAIIRLTRNGALDPTWDGDGIAIVDTVGPANSTDDANGTTRSLNENPRQAIIEPNGRVVVGAYSSGEGRAQGRVLRFLPNGALDQSFGAGGIATVPGNFFHADGGPSSTIEFYDIARQGSSYVVCGYGRGVEGVPVDAISARFGPTGQADPTYGTDGAVTIDLAGEEDRCRDLEVLGDGRVLLSGSGTPENQTSPRNIDAMLVALDRNGQPINGFGPGGVLTIDFGGNSDSLYGIARTIDTTRAIAVGFTGNSGSPTAGVADDGRAVRYNSLRRGAEN